MSDTIQIHAAHNSEDMARRDVEFVINTGAREVEPETAAAIAAWWQSSGSIGSILAAFASGAAVDKTALLDDIAATRNHYGYHTGQMRLADRQALDCLSTFTINHQPYG